MKQSVKLEAVLLRHAIILQFLFLFGIYWLSMRQFLVCCGAMVHELERGKGPPSMERSKSPSMERSKSPSVERSKSPRHGKEQEPQAWKGARAPAW